MVSPLVSDPLLALLRFPWPSRTNCKLAEYISEELSVGCDWGATPGSCKHTLRDSHAEHVEAKRRLGEQVRRIAFLGCRVKPVGYEVGSPAEVGGHVRWDLLPSSQ